MRRRVRVGLPVQQRDRHNPGGSGSGGGGGGGSSSNTCNCSRRELGGGGRGGSSSNSRISGIRGRGADADDTPRSAARWRTADVRSWRRWWWWQRQRSDGGLASAYAGLLERGCCRRDVGNETSGRARHRLAAGETLRGRKVRLPDGVDSPVVAVAADCCCVAAVV